MEKGFRMWLFLGLALAFASTIAYAEEQYRTEISATYQRFNFKGEAGAEDGGLGVELFLAPVNTDNHPYAEAGFLEKIGSLGFSGKLHYFYQTEAARGEGNPVYDIFFNYTRPDFPLIAGLEWRRQVSDLFNINPTTGSLNELLGDRDFYELSLGTYLSYGFLVRIGYGEEHAKETFWTYIGYNPATDNDRVKQYRMNIKYVKELSGGTAINLEASAVQQKFSVLGESKDSEYLSLGGDFYFTRWLNAGLNFRSNNSALQYADGKGYAVRAGIFFTPSLSLKAGYERFLSDNESRWWENRSYSLTLAARF